MLEPALQHVETNLIAVMDVRFDRFTRWKLRYIHRENVGADGLLRETKLVVGTAPAIVSCPRADGREAPMTLN